jgi:hypothetical protein
MHLPKNLVLRGVSREAIMTSGIGRPMRQKQPESRLTDPGVLWLLQYFSAGQYLALDGWH